MSFLNAVLRGLFDLLLMPFRGMSPWVSLIPISLATAVLALLVYRRFSNQGALEAIKKQIAASFFEIRLFNDDLGAILRAQWDLLRNNGIYMALNLRPLLWMLLPMLILIFQLQVHYGYRGLVPGEPAVVSLTFSKETVGKPAQGGPRPRIELRSPEGLTLERGGVWIPSRRELAWRLVPQAEGRYELEFDIDGQELTKTVVVSRNVVRRSPVRFHSSFLNQLLNPAEAPIDDSLGVEAIRVAYPEAQVAFLGLRLHWMIVWLVLTMVFAFLLRKRFGVTF